MNSEVIRMMHDGGCRDHTLVVDDGVINGLGIGDVFTVDVKSDVCVGDYAAVLSLSVFKNRNGDGDALVARVFDIAEDGMSMVVENDGR